MDIMNGKLRKDKVRFGNMSRENTFGKNRFPEYGALLKNNTFLKWFLDFIKTQFKK
jgi:hypothetical protein